MSSFEIRGCQALDAHIGATCTDMVRWTIAAIRAGARAERIFEAYRGSLWAESFFEKFEGVASRLREFAEGDVVISLPEGMALRAFSEGLEYLAAEFDHEQECEL